MQVNILNMSTISGGCLSSLMAGRNFGRKRCSFCTQLGERFVVDVWGKQRVKRKGMPRFLRHSEIQ